MNDAATGRARKWSDHERLMARLRKPWIDHPDEPLWSQVVQEVKINLRPPFEVLSVVVINVSMVLGVWFFLNPSLVQKYTALIFLPMAVASWAFADVPATNLFGGRSQQVREHLREPVQIRRIMTVENIALWLFISPGCFILSLALIPSQRQPLLSLAVAIAVMFVPFAYLGLAAIMAPLLPFHPLPWRERLQRRDTWLRYGAAVTIAYFALTWPAMILATGPATFILTYIGDTPTHYLVAAILVTPWSLFIWRLGIHISTRISLRRADWLDEFLADPERG